MEMKNITWADKLKSVANKPIKIDSGDKIYFPNKWVLWCHDIKEKQWDINSYKKLYTIHSVSDFWNIFNNIHKLGLRAMHLFLMKENINPTWEDEANRNGGVCSLKINIKTVKNIWTDIIIQMVCNNLNNNYDDINGTSISPKNQWAIVKIWNKDNKNDLTKTLSKQFLTKYENISIKYRPNNPEH